MHTLDGSGAVTSASGDNPRSGEVVSWAARDVSENTAAPVTLQVAFLRRRGISNDLAAVLGFHAFALVPAWWAAR